MHRTLFVLVAALLTVIPSAARADVGPPPSCPPGTYHAYLYGHKCVPNGSHLERDPEGGVKFVKDGELAATPTPKPKVAPPVETPTAKPSETPPPVEFASPPPAIPPATSPAIPSANAEPVAFSAEALPNPTTTPPPQRGCTCGVPGAPEERVGFGLVIAAMIFAVGRRMQYKRSTH